MHRSHHTVRPAISPFIVVYMKVSYQRPHWYTPRTTALDRKSNHELGQVCASMLHARIPSRRPQMRIVVA